jgi:DNA-binding GntR family transcriptional regulator
VDDEVPGGAGLAAAFGVEEGTALWRRVYVFEPGEDPPPRLGTSYLLAPLVRGTPVADPARQPWPGGTITQLDTLGLRVSAWEEEVRARMPSPEERAGLDLGYGVPVTVVRRRLYGAPRDDVLTWVRSGKKGQPAGVHVVEVADVVGAGDRVVMRYGPLDLRQPEERGLGS